MNDNFIGMGSNPNPEVPDIPLGLGMHLAQNPNAHAKFGTLSNNEKTQIIKYIQASQTGEEVVERISETIDRLSN